MVAPPRPICCRKRSDSDPASLGTEAVREHFFKSVWHGELGVASSSVEQFSRTKEDAVNALAPLDATWFRQVLGQYPTGVSVVTGIGPQGEPVGMAVGTFTSVSLDPPMVGFLPAKTSSSWPKIRASGSFCINILGQHQEHVCRAFASKDPDKFRGLTWRPAASGAPVIDGVVAWIDCELEAVHPAGDHLIVVGRVGALDVESQMLPLLFFQGGYGGFTPHSFVSGETDLAPELRLVDIARPEMERLAHDLDARCLAVALVGDSVVVMASAGTAIAGWTDFIGQRTPALPPAASLFMAYAEEDVVERWLAHLDTGKSRDNWRQRLDEVRQRGFTVALDSPAHTEYERWLQKGELSRHGPDSVAAKRVIQSLPYDPLGFTLDDDSEVRSLHAPVFGPQGEVALALTIFRHKRDPLDVKYCVARLLEAADRVTKAAGGQRPAQARQVSS